MNERAELLQALIEKISTVMKSLHSRSCFPFGEFQLSRPQIMLLFFIAKRKEGVSSKDLAAFLNVTSGAITQFVDILVEKKLVQREEDAEDRRLLRMKLTKIAKTKLAVFKKKYYKTVSPAFDGLTEQEMQKFMILLNKIKLFSE